MTCTPSAAGSVGVFVSIIALLHCSSSSTHPNVKEVRAPTIVKTKHKYLCPGYRLTCKVDPGGLKDETLVYWLADGDFIEQVYKNVSVRNTETRSRRGTRQYLHSKVVLRNLPQQDVHLNFTCVALSPAGFAKENIQIRHICNGSTPHLSTSVI